MTSLVHLLPVDELLKYSEVSSNLNIYLANMVYVGVLAFLIGIEMEKIESALDQHFNGKRNAIEPNLKVVTKSFDWAKANLKERCPFILATNARDHMAK